MSEPIGPITAEVISDLQNKVFTLQSDYEIILTRWREASEKLQKLEKALKRALDEGANYVGDDFYSAGCGCCAYRIKPPPELYQLLHEIISPPASSEDRKP